MGDAVSQADLKTVLMQARRVAAALGQAVGPREMLLAAVTVCPETVVARARERGIDMRRLHWALLEWGPIRAAGDAAAAACSVTAAARAILAGIGDGDRGQACSALVDRLLDPAALGPEPGPEPETGPAPDATSKVLSRLRLI